MPEKSSVFKETYQRYLSEIGTLDLETVAPRIAARFNDRGIQLELFSRTYRIDGGGISDRTGKRPSFDQCVILSKYVIMAPAVAPTPGDWVNYRGLKDAGPLIGYFTKGTEGAIAREFSGNAPALEQAGLALGGFLPDMDATYDVALQFKALPKVPMVLLFNDADDEFPATCSVLFDKHAETYLDAECLAMMGGLLATLLKRKQV